MKAKSENNNEANTLDMSPKLPRYRFSTTRRIDIGINDCELRGTVVRCSICGANYRTTDDIGKVVMRICPECLAMTPELSSLI
jgi:hypothetical protein